jgi:hypothetical protein
MPNQVMSHNLPLIDLGGYNFGIFDGSLGKKQGRTNVVNG